MGAWDDWLAAASIERAVAELRPDYRCVLLVAEGLVGGESNAASEALVAEAEASAEAVLAGRSAEELPHLAAWREAFRAFGAKPQRTRNSAEALLRRAGDGMPRIDRLTDAYNAVSVLTQTPLGGENLGAYRGPLQLVRAVGDEDFDTLASGAEVIEHPEPGEVCWRDDAGITCRRWNWRQCYRTRLTTEVSEAVFVCDVLTASDLDADARAALVLARLSDALARVSPGVALSSRVIAAG